MLYYFFRTSVPGLSDSRSIGEMMSVIQLRHTWDNEVSGDGPRRQDDEQPSDFLFDKVPEHACHSDLCRGGLSNNLQTWSQ